MKPRRWPRPADTAVDRARAIAREYRQALWQADPVRCAVLDRAAEEFGEQWVSGAVQHSDSELVTLAELAVALGEKYSTVWQWWNRGRIPREPNGLFRFDHVVDALARWRRDRVGHVHARMTAAPTVVDDPVGDGGVVGGAGDAG